MVTEGCHELRVDCKLRQTLGVHRDGHLRGGEVEGEVLQVGDVAQLRETGADGPPGGEGRHSSG